MRVACANEDQISSFLDHVIKDEGEGVILRKANSLYFNGRSPELWKLKVLSILYFLTKSFQASRGDKEALVLDEVEDNQFLLQLY